MSRIRFAIYRYVVALSTLLAFRSQKVEALAPPTETHVDFRPYATSFPEMPIKGLFDPTSFSPADTKRLRRIGFSRKMLGTLRRAAPPTTAPVPRDEKAFLDAVYPGPFRKAWPTAPAVPPELESGGGAPPDVLAELAVRGPFGSFLRRATDDHIATHGLGAGSYVLDVSWMERYAVVPGLQRSGGIAVLEVADGGLRTTAIVRQGSRVDVRAASDGRAERDAVLAAMNEELTTFRHNIGVHLALLTSFGLASVNHLGVDHPLRRLLHHCFHTVLIGNHEVGSLQLSGPKGFSAAIFSHDNRTIATMANEFLGRYDVWDFEPDTQFARRGTTETPFAYPYRENVLELWAANLAYVNAYVALYFGDDKAVRSDTAVTAWLQSLDELLPNGVSRPADGPTRGWLARLCATLIHVSTVEHDILNNVTWDYSTPGAIVPTVVPASGEPMDRRRSFDLLATIIGTWKPYNMLLTADVPSLALDEEGRKVMADWIAELERIQQEMAARPHDPSLSYPANLNVSISN